MNEEQTTGGMKKIIGVVVVAAVAAGAFFLTKNKEPVTTDEGELTPSTGTATTTDQVSATSTSELAFNYRDGTYTQEGTYQSPAGEEKVSVQLTITKDVVTAASFRGLATNPASIKWQDTFSKGYVAEVVGKPVNQINLAVVNGSSLTPKGFMDALVDIKSAAEVK